jgi:acetyl esterase/lipase
MARSALGLNAFRADVLPSPGYTRVLNVVYSGALALDIWKPNQASRPVLILCHGGGWTGGDKTDPSQTYPATLFAELGFCVMSANMTLTGGAPATPITDIKNLVTWARANAATYNGDGTRVATLGSSSGGHEALMAAIQGVAGGTRPDAVIGWSPPCNLGALTGSGAGFALAYMGTTFAGDAAGWNAKSPTLIIAGPICPIRIVGSATEDTANGGIAQSQYDGFETAALAVGADVTKRIFTGAAHAEMDGKLVEASNDIAGTAAWLRRKLAWPRVAGGRAAAAARAAAAGRVAA